VRANLHTCIRLADRAPRECVLGLQQQLVVVQCFPGPSTAALVSYTTVCTNVVRRNCPRMIFTAAHSVLRPISSQLAMTARERLMLSGRGASWRSWQRWASPPLEDPTTMTCVWTLASNHHVTCRQGQAYPPRTLSAAELLLLLHLLLQLCEHAVLLGAAPVAPLYCCHPYNLCRSLLAHVGWRRCVRSRPRCVIFCI
jgi:hypothetical protein